jgi:nucleoside-diphosphate-sugar epimerase
MQNNVKYRNTNISLAIKVLGYEPEVSLKDGLQEIIDSKRK